VTIVTLLLRKSVGRTTRRGFGPSGRRFTGSHAPTCLALVTLLTLAPRNYAGAEVPHRNLPHPLSSHPGNIFLAGEKIIVPAPPGEGENWRVVDYENQTVARGVLQDGRAEIGPLPVGWYKIVRGGRGYGTNRAFLGVLAPLRAPTPRTSPVAIDAATAWFWPKEKMGDVASLCQLAGINRVRDRLNWPQMEPKPGEFSGPNQYDDAARIQHDAGLQILQVNHLSPAWANPDARRFPPDLRDAYRFYREMARRWRGLVDAFEPWNEADIKMFGGHTGSEMASLQKSAYLGLKAGNPDVTACLNVFAIRRAATLQDFHANEAWPYFDTYNFHTYELLENYPSVYAAHRAVSAGKPLWVTETSMHIKWRGDEHLKELGDENLRLQSERLTKTYALAFHEGAQAVFYFVLPHYAEGQLQFGLLRPDLTPRPGYLALAAVGRLLADAKPLGRVKTTDDAVRGYLFDAQPDGKPADVLVAWADAGGTLKLPKPPLACFDHLGRARPVTNAVLTLTRAPVYALLADGARPALVPPPAPAARLTGDPCEMVMQALLPEADTALEASAYKLAAARTKTVPLFLYNFGPGAAKGRLTITAPEGWKVHGATEVEIPPGERKGLRLEVTPPAARWNEAAVRVAGNFGPAGRAVLSLRFTPAPD
jgi:hypothetical protein